MRPSSVLAGLLLAGCSLGGDALAPPLGGGAPPDLARLAPKIQSTFSSAKLTGYPRVSRPRAAPVSALGDWIVCLRSDAVDSRVYAVIISGSDVVDYRLALQIDGCASESFAPLPNGTLVK
jgi:hypothetical protein